MKKFARLILALSMTFILCVSASAETISVNNGSENMPVQIKVTEGVGGTVYNVTVAWESMDFTYKKAASGTWDPDTHTYSNGNAAGWTVNGNQKIAEVDTAGNYTAVSSAITVTNHSNAQVTVDAALNENAKTAEHDGVTLALSTDAADQVLENAAEKAYDYVAGADQIVYTLKVSGVPGSSYDTTSAEINTITVKIS